MDSWDIVQKISLILNTRLDSLENKVEKLISDNTLKIEGLKKSIDFAFGEIREIKENVKQVDVRVSEAEKKVSILEQRVADLENYGRQRNLRLYRVAENKEQDIRKEATKICQAILPDLKAKLPDVIDTVHRLG